MDWQQYEDEILQNFVEAFPGSKVTKNVSLIGRYSKVARQVDVLVEGSIAGFQFRIAIDGKHHRRPIDVPYVEAFIGFCSDIGAQKGVLISPKGFTPAAINRAHYDGSDIELDVLNFADLKQFQSCMAIPFSGTNAVALIAPFGWIIDGTRRDNMVATLYQRGFDIQEAGKKREWMYVNFWSRTDAISSLNELTKKQDHDLLSDSPKGEISYLDGPIRPPYKTLIRRFEDSGYPAVEFTGFIEFENFILFCVMFTPKELANRNLRKLDHVLRTALPIAVKSGDNA